MLQKDSSALINTSHSEKSDSMKEAEIELWNGVKEGTNEAFNILYERYADLLFGYGMKLIANEDFVTEVIQSFFVYIYEKRTRLSMPNSITSYILISFKRMLLTEWNKKKHLVGIDNESDMDRIDFHLQTDFESTIINSEEEKDKLSLLNVSLEKLSQQQREVIYLKYFQHLSNDDIANIIGTTNQVIRNVASRSLKRLKDLMK